MDTLLACSSLPPLLFSQGLQATCDPFFGSLSIIRISGIWFPPPPSALAQTVKNLPVMQGTWVSFLGWEDVLEKGMATHSSILAWRIPLAEGLAGYSPRGRKESDTTE